MGLAIVFLLILLVVAVVAIPVLTRVFREAADRNPNAPGDRKDGDGDRG